MEMFILSLPDQVLLESSEQGVEREQDFSDFSLLPLLLLAASSCSTSRSIDQLGAAF